MKKYGFFMLLLLAACSGPNRLKKYYTAEDKTVFDLVEKLKKNGNDKEALEQLPQVYKTVSIKRKALTEANYNNLVPGDRYMQLAKEYGVMLQMYKQISEVPAAKKIIDDLWDPSRQIQDAKNTAANEYYSQGLEYLTYNNRVSARNAYDFFSKANEAVPGYKDVRQLMQEATERATIKVIVRAANYYNRNWNYWGFENDWLQQHIINDLNNQSFRDVRFYSDWDASSRQIRPDRLVELNFTELFVGQVFVKRYTINRSKEVQTGTTKSIPAKPVYTTVYATVNVTSRYMQSRATLECRIYDQVTGHNLLFDRFPGNDDWRTETATYTGNQDALLPEDWSRINSSNNFKIPSRAEVANRLIRNCYSSLLNRIKTGVQFGSD
ncbi:MAG: hypothetical protein JWR61_5110 [Ferruginibacter sp.]|uniref:hypothetical protein n=1 Tax=Ferruginibacter sp. TaxID=1940288 RepID=UPI002659AFBE|nr:hypothetical protein [Ferruginibacter sp.]MDB5280155.1 hypothetical protein [Ferruginibacter sp.]